MSRMTPARASELLESRVRALRATQVAANWEFRKTRIHNMAKLGLANDVNVSIHREGAFQRGGAGADEHAKPVVKLAMFDIPQSDDLTHSSTNDRRNPMSEDKQKYIARLITKHGENYEKMQHDRKANPMQSKPRPRLFRGSAPASIRCSPVLPPLGLRGQTLDRAPQVDDGAVQEGGGALHLARGQAAPRPITRERSRALVKAGRSLAGGARISQTNIHNSRPGFTVVSN